MFFLHQSVFKKKEENNTISIKKKLLVSKNIVVQ